MFSIPVAATPGYSHNLDVQVRLDNRSNRAHREQYRLRYYPSVTFSENSAWSLNSFVVSGDDFSSSHNTFGSDNTDRIYVRRLFVRHTGDYGKTEAGVIPTYKGRVSSSGLSKDGWIEGLRHVRYLPNDSALELVVGQLHNTNPANALSTPDDLDYIELEYSARMGQAQSFEISAERMTNGNFLRGEYRWRFSNEATVFVELIKRLDKDETKTVMGLSGQWQMGNYPLEYFAHYSYVSEGFGPRAELTEDFLGTGHGMSAELEGELWSDWQLDWFVRLDVVDSVSRVLTGVKFPLHYP
ncbi:hypothetical protein [Alteromonas halophila]|uniref:Uncharacterized protein n=1 Tax=Alteromonas halophila TaxID=516698 RepID=A0A918JMP2_9ALTE|nr:hypothetical protein [Alteromonas halophila]GGW90543.1 hypothetical protein GCM10007391_25970 [Alteromonas halophila]